MVTWTILLRIIHLFGGIFWAGYGLFNIGFLSPTIRATGIEGQQVMRHLTQKTQFLNTAYLASTLTVFSGILLYWIAVGFRMPAMMSGKGLVLLIGGVSGTIAWLIVIIPVRGIFNQMKTTTQQIQAQGTPPHPDQVARMQGLAGRLASLSKTALALLVLTILSMAIARYVV